MARFPGLVRGPGSLAGSSAVRDASWFAWSRVHWKTKAMFRPARSLRPQASWREKSSKSTFSYRTPVQYR